jgi:hypothetical protein
MPATMMPELTRTTLEPSHEVAVRAQILDSIEERRTAPRERSNISATLRTLRGAQVIDCPADNISEGGLRITAPIGFGLAVGQRFEVILEGGDRHSDLIGDGHYATVVRTEIVLDRGTRDDRVGIGLRFDQPVVF